MLTYEEAREFIQETSKYGSVLGLDNMRALMNELGNVQNTIPTIHIAGTNGKGSVGAYLASICKEAGFKVGRYCSPAVFSPLECWQYDGRLITEEEYAECMSQVKAACDILATRSIHPTAFEVETALAFVFFSKMKTDVFLLETGLGGETDATNVVDNPLACVITTISRDHMQFLGDTLKEIATVKAGIMKPGAHIIWGEQEPEVEAVLNDRYEEVYNRGVEFDNPPTKGEVYFSRTELIYQKPGELKFSYLGQNFITKMSGLYQMKNAVLAIELFDNIWPRLLFGLKDEMEMWQDENNSLDCWMDMEYACRLGVYNATWPGRFEVLGNNPLFIIDGAHNEDAAKQLAQTIENSFTNQPLTYIIGVLSDKEHKKMLEIMLPYASKVYTITPENARGMDGRVLLEEAKEVCMEQNLSVDMEFCESIVDALDKAMDYAIKNNQPILAFGSLSYLGSLRNAYASILKRCV